jgi:hypothetical protein
MGRPPRPDPDLEELEELDEDELPDRHVVRRYLVTHERPGRSLPRRPREADPRRRRPGRQTGD